jgi:hypothetical protein
MKRLRRLCEATRAISSSARITLLGVPDRDDLWVIRVSVGDVILVETGAGVLDKVLVESAKKLQSLSQRILLAAAEEVPEDGPDDSGPIAPPKS